MPDPDTKWISALGALADLYADADRLGDRLRALHGARLHCERGCHACCVDGVTVFAVEAENIRRYLAKWLVQATPHPEGGCAFLDAAGACRIYRHRPYVCRTQGLPLRWIEGRPDGEAVELRDICPLNEAGDPVETLPPDTCWTIGPFEGRLAALQATLDGGTLRRVPLRSLLRRGFPSNATPWRGILLACTGTATARDFPCALRRGVEGNAGSNALRAMRLSVTGAAHTP